MSTKLRRQKTRARRAGQSDDVLAFVSIVNDGAYTFPHAYALKHGRQIVRNQPVTFDASRSALHAEVQCAAVAIADQLVIAGAARGWPAARRSPAL